MKTYLQFLLLVLLINNPLYSKDKNASKDQVAYVSGLNGSVYVKRVDGKKWLPATDKLSIKKGDLIKTGFQETNAVKIVFTKKQKIILGPNSLIEIKNLKAFSLIYGQVEVTSKKKINIIGLKGSIKTKRKKFVILKDEIPVVVKKSPTWLKYFKNQTVKSPLGSIQTKINGVDVDLKISEHHVVVDIKDQIAHTTITETFLNHTHRNLEGVFYFPLPADASISSLAMWINGEKVEGDIVEKERARIIFETIVRENRDPALLEWAGGNLFQARVFPIFPHSSKKIQISYTQVLKKDQSNLYYRYALTSEKLIENPLHKFSMKVNISLLNGIEKVLCPNYLLQKSLDKKSAQLEFSRDNFSPQKDFELKIKTNKEKDSIQLIRYENEQEGYFMVLFQPEEFPKIIKEKKQHSRELMIVLDTSGSILPPQQKKQAEVLDALLSQLSEKDRFNICTIDAEAKFLFKDYSTFNSAKGKQALSFYHKRGALGWSDLSLGFEKVYEKCSEATTVVYIGDGIPTAHDVSPRAFVKEQKALWQNSKGTFFSVSTGNTYESALMKSIATFGKADGLFLQVNEGKSSQEVASEIFKMLDSQKLTNISMVMKGKETKAIYLDSEPYLLSGNQALWIGRYKRGDHQKLSIKIKGHLNNQEKAFDRSFDLSKSENANSFLPRLWAKKHLNFLLEKKQTEEVKKSVVSLSEKYQIMTPYTSFLVLESNADRERFKVNRTLRIVGADRFFDETKSKKVKKYSKNYAQELYQAIKEYRKDLLLGLVKYEILYVVYGDQRNNGSGIDAGISFDDSDESSEPEKENTQESDSLLEDLIDATFDMTSVQKRNDWYEYGCFSEQRDDEENHYFNWSSIGQDGALKNTNGSHHLDILKMNDWGESSYYIENNVVSIFPFLPGNNGVRVPLQKDKRSWVVEKWKIFHQKYFTKNKEEIKKLTDQNGLEIVSSSTLRSLSGRVLNVSGKELYRADADWVAYECDQDVANCYWHKDDVSGVINFLNIGYYEKVLGTSDQSTPRPMIDSWIGSLEQRYSFLLPKMVSTTKTTLTFHLCPAPSHKKFPLVAGDNYCQVKFDRRLNLIQEIKFIENSILVRSKVFSGPVEVAGVHYFSKSVTTHHLTNETTEKSVLLKLPLKAQSQKKINQLIEGFNKGLLLDKDKLLRKGLVEYKEKHDQESLESKLVKFFTFSLDEDKASVVIRQFKEIKKMVKDKKGHEFLLLRMYHRLNEYSHDDFPFLNEQGLFELSLVKVLREIPKKYSFYLSKWLFLSNHFKEMSELDDEERLLKFLMAFAKESSKKQFTLPLNLKQKGEIELPTGFHKGQFRALLFLKTIAKGKKEIVLIENRIKENLLILSEEFDYEHDISSKQPTSQQYRALLKNIFIQSEKKAFSKSLTMSTKIAIILFSKYKTISISLLEKKDLLQCFKNSLDFDLKNFEDNYVLYLETLEDIGLKDSLKKEILNRVEQLKSGNFDSNDEKYVLGLLEYFDSQDFESFEKVLKVNDFEEFLFSIEKKYYDSHERVLKKIYKLLYAGGSRDAILKNIFSLLNAKKNHSKHFGYELLIIGIEDITADVEKFDKFFFKCWKGIKVKNEQSYQQKQYFAKIYLMYLNKAGLARRKVMFLEKCLDSAYGKDHLFYARQYFYHLLKYYHEDNTSKKLFNLLSIFTNEIKNPQNKNSLLKLKIEILQSLIYYTPVLNWQRYRAKNRKLIGQMTRRMAKRHERKIKKELLNAVYAEVRAIKVPKNDPFQYWVQLEQLRLQTLLGYDFTNAKNAIVNLHAYSIEVKSHELKVQFQKRFYHYLKLYLLKQGLSDESYAKMSKTLKRQHEMNGYEELEILLLIKKPAILMRELVLRYKEKRLNTRWRSVYMINLFKSKNMAKVREILKTFENSNLTNTKELQVVSNMHYAMGNKKEGLQYAGKYYQSLPAKELLDLIKETPKMDSQELGEELKLMIKMLKDKDFNYYDDDPVKYFQKNKTKESFRLVLLYLLEKNFSGIDGDLKLKAFKTLCDGIVTIELIEFALKNIDVLFDKMSDGNKVYFLGIKLVLLNRLKDFFDDKKKNQPRIQTTIELLLKEKLSVTEANNIFSLMSLGDFSDRNKEKLFDIVSTYIKTIDFKREWTGSRLISLLVNYIQRTPLLPKDSRLLRLSLVEEKLKIVLEDDVLLNRFQTVILLYAHTLARLNPQKACLVYEKLLLGKTGFGLKRLLGHWYQLKITLSPKEIIQMEQFLNTRIEKTKEHSGKKEFGEVLFKLWRHCQKEKIKVSFNNGAKITQKAFDLYFNCLKDNNDTDWIEKNLSKLFEAKRLKKEMLLALKQFLNTQWRLLSDSEKTKPFHFIAQQLSKEGLKKEALTFILETLNYYESKNDYFEMAWLSVESLLSQLVDTAVQDNVLEKKLLRISLSYLKRTLPKKHYGGKSFFKLFGEQKTNPAWLRHKPKFKKLALEIYKENADDLGVVIKVKEFLDEGLLLGDIGFKIINDYIEKHPQLIEAYQYYAKKYPYLKKYADQLKKLRLKTLKKSLKELPFARDLNAEYIRLLFQEGKKKELKKSLRFFKKHFTNYEWNLEKMSFAGDLFFDLEHYSDAIKVYSRYIQYSQRGIELSPLGSSYYDVDNYFASFKKNSYDTTTPSGFYDIGFYADEPNELETVYQNLAVSYAKLNKIELAVQTLYSGYLDRRAGYKDFSDFQDDCIKVIKELDDLQPIITALNQKQLQGDRENPYLREALGVALAFRDQRKEALVHFKIALKYSPFNKNLIDYIIECLMILDDQKGLLEFYDELIKKSPFDLVLKTKFYEAIEAGDLGETSLALRAMTSFVENAPNDAKGHEALAFQFHELDQPKEAIQQWRHVIRIRPEEPQTYIELLKIYIEVENKTEVKILWWKLTNTNWPKRFGNIKKKTDKILSEEGISFK